MYYQYEDDIKRILSEREDNLSPIFNGDINTLDNTKTKELRKLIHREEY